MTRRKWEVKVRVAGNPNNKLATLISGVTRKRAVEVAEQYCKEFDVAYKWGAKYGETGQDQQLCYIDGLGGDPVLGLLDSTVNR